jgi:competence ComEA-like helix-hairpin-helix protein
MGEQDSLAAHDFAVILLLSILLVLHIVCELDRAMNFRPVSFAKLLLLMAASVILIAASSCSRTYRRDQNFVQNSSVSVSAINLNTATEKELAELPHIGETIAHRIVEFRNQNGPFQRPEHLLLVEGISEKKFREIRPLIKTE